MTRKEKRRFHRWVRDMRKHKLYYTKHEYRYQSDKTGSAENNFFKTNIDDQ